MGTRAGRHPRTQRPLLELDRAGDPLIPRPTLHARLHRRRRPPLGRPAPAAGTCSAASATSRGCAPPACSPPREHARLRAGLRAALARGRRRPAARRAGARGRAHGRRGLAHPAAARHAASGCTPAARATTRSRCDLRLYLKDQLLALHARRARRWPRRCSTSRRATATCSGPATPTSGGRCRRRSGSGPAPMPKGSSTRVEALRGALGRRGPLAARQRRRATACRCRSSARPRRGRSASPALDHNVATVQGGRGQARGGGALLVHPAGPRARAARRRT